MNKAIEVLTEFLRLLDEEGLDLRELCEQTDLLRKHTLSALITHEAKVKELKTYCSDKNTRLNKPNKDATTPCLTNIEKVQPGYIQLPNGILDLLKATAIGTYTSNGENANDYDALMSADSFGDIPHLVLWEPFENYPIDDIKEYVESEFDSLCTVVKKSIEMYHG